METIDINTVAAKAAAELVKDFSKVATDSIVGPIRRSWKYITEDFERYLELTYKKNKFVRIISQRQTPIRLDDIYVGSCFSSSRQTITDNELVLRIREGRKVIVLGDGGLGKTFFVKKLWSSIFDHSNGKIPVFVSLRDLNDLEEADLQAFVRNSIFTTHRDSEELMRKFGNDGRFIFIFDGFDELQDAIRPVVYQELVSFSEKYDRCGMVISSRVTDRLAPWADFEEYKICPMGKDSTIELISKVPFDEGVKKKFIKQLDSGLYEKNVTFLSNPLLSVMMLITFSNHSKLPDKMSVFYENAFDALYDLHDGLKGAYERERWLDPDEFRRVFSVFCLITHSDQITSFTFASLRAFIGQSLKFLNLDKKVEVAQVQREFTEATNLLQLEGLNFTFIHRSFQEYFAAYCITSVISDSQAKFLRKFVRRISDSTFVLCWEIYPALVEREAILPIGSEYLSRGLLRKIFPSKTPKYQMVSELGHSHAMRFAAYSDKSFEVGDDAVPLSYESMYEEREFRAYLEQLARISNPKLFSELSKQDEEFSDLGFNSIDTFYSTLSHEEAKKLTGGAIGLVIEVKPTSVVLKKVLSDIPLEDIEPFDFPRKELCSYDEIDADFPDYFYQSLDQLEALYRKASRHVSHLLSDLEDNADQRGESISMLLGDA